MEESFPSSPCIVKLRKKRGVLFVRGCNVKIHCTVFQHNPLYIQIKQLLSQHSYPLTSRTTLMAQKKKHSRRQWRMKFAGRQRRRDATELRLTFRLCSSLRGRRLLNGFVRFRATSALATAPWGPLMRLVGRGDAGEEERKRSSTEPALPYLTQYH